MFLNILLFLLLFICKGEEPQKMCDPVTPFKKKDNTCGNFTDICLKKDDEDCNYFQEACKQCPASNYTVLMLLDIKSQMRSNFDGIKNEINISNSRIKEPIVIACLFFIILNFILGISIIIIEIRKPLQTLFCNTRRGGSSIHTNNEEMILLNNNQQGNEDVRSELINIQQTVHQDIVEATTTFINIQHQDNTKLLEDVKEMINEKEYSALDSVVCYKLRFQIVNQFDETKLFVSKFDNIIKLKKSICKRNMNMKDYKRMIMKYKGVTLDNNQYLLSCIDSTNIPIFCEFDNNVDVNAMIVIKLKCDNIYPEMLQIRKNQQIKDLKIIISKLNKTNKDLLIFYKSEQLDDDKTIDDYKIEDNDRIQVVYTSEEIQNITMKSIFTDKETISIKFSKFETVSDIINKSIQKIQLKMTTNQDFVIFLDNKLLQNDKFIYEYNIDSKSLVEFCYFKNLNEIENKKKITDSNHINMFKANNKCIDRSVMLKAYSKQYMINAHHGELSSVLKEDLQMFQITKCHSRFIQIFGIYLDDDWVYLGLENSILKIMAAFLSLNKEISRYEISKWAYQILNGLKHLHNHNIFMKDMNPKNIWIDGNHDVKLPSFNMTNYLNHLHDDIETDNDTNTNVYIRGNLTYVAPEILEGKPNEASVDVWSLGVIMIEVGKRGRIYSELSDESKIVQKIKDDTKQYGTIQYDKTRIEQPDLINFIDSCVKGDPKKRATIDELMKHEFIKKYLLFSNFVQNTFCKTCYTHF